MTIVKFLSIAMTFIFLIACSPQIPTGTYIVDIDKTFSIDPKFANVDEETKEFGKAMMKSMYLELKENQYKFTFKITDGDTYTIDCTIKEFGKKDGVICNDGSVSSIRLEKDNIVLTDSKGDVYLVKKNQ